MKAVNIKWDTDGDQQTLSKLPSEIAIPEDLNQDEDAISDYLTKVTGFCHKGFLLENDAD